MRIGGRLWHCERWLRRRNRNEEALAHGQELLSDGVSTPGSSIGSVTASFGHYDVSGTTYVVPYLHAKIGHVDPELK